MATARRPPAAANPALDNLCALIAKLARRHGIGTVGLVGAHADGTALPHDATELFVTVPFDQVEAFAHALTSATERAVHLFDFDLVPWAHPIHLCVRWLNVAHLPVRDCPHGAITRWKVTRHGQTFGAAVQLGSLPHFRATDAPIVQRRGEFMRVIQAPALGGFLI